MRNSVDEDLDQRIFHRAYFVRLDVVVRRPGVSAREAWNCQHDHGHCKVSNRPWGHVQQHYEQNRHHQTPYHRWRLEEGQDGKTDGAEDAATDVEPVGLERFKFRERPRYTVGDGRQHSRHHYEDHGQHHPCREPGALEIAEEDEARSRTVDFDGKRGCEADQEKHE